MRGGRLGPQRRRGPLEREQAGWGRTRSGVPWNAGRGAGALSVVVGQKSPKRISNPVRRTEVERIEPYHMLHELFRVAPNTPQSQVEQGVEDGRHTFNPDAYPAVTPILIAQGAYLDRKSVV